MRQIFTTQLLTVRHVAPQDTDRNVSVTTNYSDVTSHYVICIALNNEKDI